jgi:hypothetical protein
MRLAIVVVCIGATGFLLGVLAALMAEVVNTQRLRKFDRASEKRFRAPVEVLVRDKDFVEEKIRDCRIRRTA